MSGSGNSKHFLTAYCSSSPDLAKPVAVDNDEYGRVWMSLLSKVSHASTRNPNREHSPEATRPEVCTLKLKPDLKENKAFSLTLYHQKVHEHLLKARKAREEAKSSGTVRLQPQPPSEAKRALDRRKLFAERRRDIAQIRALEEYLSSENHARFNSRIQQRQPANKSGEWSE